MYRPRTEQSINMIPSIQHLATIEVPQLTTTKWGLWVIILFQIRATIIVRQSTGRKQVTVQHYWSGFFFPCFHFLKALEFGRMWEKTPFESHVRTYV